MLTLFQRLTYFRLVCWTMKVICESSFCSSNACWNVPLLIQALSMLKRWVSHCVMWYLLFLLVEGFSSALFILHYLSQGAYNSGKPGNLREFVNSGELGEFEIYSGISCISDAVFSWRNLKHITSRHVTVHVVPVSSWLSVIYCVILRKRYRNDCWGDSLHRVFTL